MTLLPRKVPWANRAEFERVSDWIFGSDGDRKDQLEGVHRIKAWISRGCCPHAVESTFAILQVVLSEDEEHSTSDWEQRLRLSYSMAIIRFVNGLVDPFQQGAYARSIASLAAQIGLPLWFVELRHAATHEDLPTLPVLRDAARQALDWLYMRYWIPQINHLQQGGGGGPTAPSLLTDASVAPTVSPLTPLLKSYKSIRKEIIRDSSLKGAKKGDLQRILRGIEKEVDEGLGSSAGAGSDWLEGNGRDGFGKGLEGVADALVEIGNLVPVSKKKRANARSLDLPSESREIWDPLLHRLGNTFGDDFTEMLLERMMVVLVSDGGNVDQSYKATICAWIFDILSRLPSDERVEDAMDDGDGVDARGSLDDNPKESVRYTIARTCLMHTRSPICMTMVEKLSRSDSELRDRLKPILTLKRSEPIGISIPSTNEEVESKLSTISDRLDSLFEERTPRPSPQPERVSSVGVAQGTMPAATGGDGVGGMTSRWRKMDERDWGPCPIGCLPDGSVPDLLLPSD